MRKFEVRVNPTDVPDCLKDPVLVPLVGNFLNASQCLCVNPTVCYNAKSIGGHGYKLRGDEWMGAWRYSLIPEVAVVVEDEASRHRLDNRLGRVDRQKDVPVKIRRLGRGGGGHDE